MYNTLQHYIIIRHVTLQCIAILKRNVVFVYVANRDFLKAQPGFSKKKGKSLNQQLIFFYLKNVIVGWLVEQTGTI